MKKALIFNGKMVDLVSIEFDVPPSMSWVDCSDSVQDFWEYDPETGAFNDPTPLVTVQSTRDEKLIELKNLRQQKETGGITTNGMQVSTDRESQSLIIGARIAAKEAIDSSTTYVISWKADNGWVQLDAPTIVYISNLVRQHVQDCFDAEQVHDIALSSLNTITSIQNYDLTTGWPV